MGEGEGGEVMSKLKKAVKEIRDMRIADEAKEIEIDEWFNNLPTYRKADIANHLWEEITYKQKREEYIYRNYKIFPKEKEAKSDGS